MILKKMKIRIKSFKIVNSFLKEILNQLFKWIIYVQYKEIILSILLGRLWIVKQRILGFTTKMKKLNFMILNCILKNIKNNQLKIFLI